MLIVCPLGDAFLDIKSSGALLHQCNLKLHSERINVTCEWPHVLFIYQLDDKKSQEPHESHSYPGPDDYLMYYLVKICGLGFVFVSVCFPDASDVYCNFFLMFLVQLPTRLVICFYMFIKHVHNQKWHPHFMPTEKLLPWPQRMSLAVKVASKWNLLLIILKIRRHVSIQLNHRQAKYKIQ